MYVDSRRKDQTQVIVPQLIRRKLYLQKKDYFIFTLFLAVPTSDPGFEHVSLLDFKSLSMLCTTL